MQYSQDILVVKKNLASCNIQDILVVKKNFFVVYLKFQFNWVPGISPDNSRLEEDKKPTKKEKWEGVWTCLL